MVDDFCIENSSSWNSIGRKLIQEIKVVAKSKGAVQIVVVSGTHDRPKCALLKSLGLTVASKWYIGEIR